MNGVGKSTILRILASGNDGFQSTTYPIKICLCMFVYAKARASGTASAQIQLLAVAQMQTAQEI